MKAVVITISDSCYHSRKEDLSGRALCKLLKANDWEIVATRIVADEIFPIQEQIRSFADQNNDLIVTTGGTGLSPCDVTPEAVHPLLDKEVYGMAELMRLRGLERTEFASLSPVLGRGTQANPNLELTW